MNARKLMAATGAVAVVGWRLLARRREDLSGQVVLITGGSRGLGLALGRAFADEGCKIAICARDEAELVRARHELTLRGAPVLALTCDVSDATAVQRMVDQVIARFGRLDVVVNNASIIQVGPIETMSIPDFELVMATNFWGTVNTTLAALPQMWARKGGRIVNITSIGGKVAFPHLLPYDCAKFAVIGFSEGLRAELAKDGIRVTTIVPGFMRTGSPLHAQFKGRREEEMAWFGAGDILPISAMSVERAARRIVLATARGEAEVTLSWQARVLRLVHDLFPGLTADFLGVVNRLLPSAKGGEAEAVEGHAVNGARGFLRSLLVKAGVRYNQVSYTSRPVPGVH
jgi:NAD(P)-dependent dehydrogenase (short-subunit alcohol dehydrogenase family)